MLVDIPKKLRENAYEICSSDVRKPGGWAGYLATGTAKAQSDPIEWQTANAQLQL